jgi:hypothetical protein
MWMKVQAKARGSAQSCCGGIGHLEPTRNPAMGKTAGTWTHF